MKTFTVYDVLTGSILRTGNCQDETFEAQAMNSGEAVIEGVGDWKTQRVINGVFQQIS